MRLFKKKNVLNEYPCSDFLHSALHLLKQGKVDAAYDEICYAIIRSGGKLTEEEQEFRRHPVVRGKRADWKE